MEQRQGQVWNESEIILALCLYYRIENGDITNQTKAKKELAEYLGRTLGSIERKLGNLRFCDAKKTSGLKNINKSDKILFDKYLFDLDGLFRRGQEISANKNLFGGTASLITQGTPYETSVECDGILKQEEIDFHGNEVVRLQTTREKQWAFRTSLLSAYERHCCLSDISVPQLLIASHIVPWKDDASKRLDPRNGLLLNAILDKAFDNGIITIDSNTYTLVIHDGLKDEKAREYLSYFSEKKISLPKNAYMRPLKENLEYHNDLVFGRFNNK